MATCTKHGEWERRFLACPQCFVDGDPSRPYDKDERAAALKNTIGDIMLRIVRDWPDYKHPEGFTRWGRVSRDINSAIDAAFVPESQALDRIEARKKAQEWGDGIPQRVDETHAAVSTSGQNDDVRVVPRDLLFGIACRLEVEKGDVAQSFARKLRQIIGDPVSASGLIDSHPFRSTGLDVCQSCGRPAKEHAPTDTTGAKG